MGFIIELLFRLVFEVPLLRTVALTIVPALLLLWYVRSKDRLEPEPPKLLPWNWAAHTCSHSSRTPIRCCSMC